MNCGPALQRLTRVRAGEWFTQCDVDVISDVLPFGRLWYGGPDAVRNALGYAEFTAAHMMLVRLR
jgi:hypothetical protein